MSTLIYPDRSEYSINGVKYSSIKYAKGKIGSSGHFGIGVYITTEIREVWDIEIKEL